ncbi:MAG: DUF4124 domain-containing protein, partial [Rubrivivax sp.]|nr:DUF4124 domain-containing protein [Rubrivivax sp.]
MTKALPVTLSLLLAAVLLSTLPTTADAQWRWRDKTGQINASDRPPPRDEPDKDILSRPASVDARRTGAAGGGGPPPPGPPGVSAGPPGGARGLLNKT